MRYLVVAPQLGYQLSGDLIPGGLLQFGRCVLRAMGSFPQIKKLGIFCQVDPSGVEEMIERTVRTYAHPSLELDIRAFGGSRAKLVAALASVNLLGDYDRVMYLLVNQATVGILPFHTPYDVWEIGEEVFLQRLSKVKHYALRHADNLLSISYNTTQNAARMNPGLPEGQVVHLCLEPPLYAPEPVEDQIAALRYVPGERDRAVMIVGNMHSTLLYKGHQQLIAGWSGVLETCPDARLWIVGDGDGRPSLEAQATMLAPHVVESITFLGRLDEDALEQRWRRCRVFAMPSRGEGFGLVFVEAARYGIPCIGGKYDSVREIILDQQTGLLVEQSPQDVANACVRLLTDDDLAQRLGNAGQQRYLHTFRFSHFRERLASALGFSS